MIWFALYMKKEQLALNFWYCTLWSKKYGSFVSNHLLLPEGYNTFFKTARYNQLLRKTWCLFCTRSFATKMYTKVIHTCTL